MASDAGTRGKAVPKGDPYRLTEALETDWVDGSGRTWPGPERDYASCSVGSSGESLRLETDSLLASEQRYYDPSAQMLVVDLLRSIHAAQLEHDARSVTKQELAEHDSRVRAELVQRVESLSQTVEELSSYLERFSARRRATMYGLWCLGGSALLVVINLVMGQVVIRSPWPQLMLGLSILFVWMARSMPAARTREPE